MSIPSLQEATQDQTEFFRYCAGVALEMKRRYGITGIRMKIKSMELPLRKGVSSSAAVCILMAKAFDVVYELGMFPHELMEVAYRGERLTGSQCGRMDQACIYGKTPVLLTFLGGKEPKVDPLRAGGNFYLLLVDLGGDKDTVKILSDLRRTYPMDENIQRVLGRTKEEIVRKAYRAITHGDSESLGGLMRIAQQEFDRYVAPASSGLGSPLLHTLLGWKPIQDYIYGGKGVGSQGDGTAQLLCKSETDREEVKRIIGRDLPGMSCFQLTIRRRKDG